MPVLTNGDFSNGLAGWDVVGAGPTAPSFDAANQRVIFGRGDNDVQNGDILQQDVSLNTGQEYTLSFTMQELGSANGGFGLNIDLVQRNADGSEGNSQALSFESVQNDETRIVTITFNSNFDDAVLRFRGGFGFGGMNSTLVLDDFVLTCFGLGTQIATPDGPVTIENLRAGDMVETLDHGARAIRWIGSRRINRLELTARPEWRPIMIPAGTFDVNTPLRDLIVSPCHRILLRGPQVEMLLNLSEGLTPAHALIGMIDGVHRLTEIDEIEYFHILFDAHEIVMSNGMETESFHPAWRTVSQFDEAARDEILALFPELTDDADPCFPMARPFLKPFEARVVLG